MAPRPRVDLPAPRKILAARSPATSLWSRGLYAPIRSGSFLASKGQAPSTCCKAKRKGWVHLSESIRRKNIPARLSPTVQEARREGGNRLGAGKTAKGKSLAFRKTSSGIAVDFAARGFPASTQRKSVFASEGCCFIGNDDGIYLFSIPSRH